MSSPDPKYKDSYEAQAQEAMYLAFGEIIASVGRGVAEAQYEMDRTSVLGAERMGGKWYMRDSKTGQRIDPDKPIDSRIDFYDPPRKAAAVVTAVDDNGKITAIKLTQVGKYYDSAPEVKIQPKDKGATATAVLDPNTKKVIGIRLDTGGSGYKLNEVEIIFEGSPKPNQENLSMLELGFIPHFYHFVDTIIDMKLAIKITKKDGKAELQTAPVDAKYAAAYNYDLDFAASVKTKIVPVPPPAPLQMRLERLLDEDLSEKM